MPVSRTSKATAALGRLVCERAITGFATNFACSQGPGFVPHVLVTVAGRDDQSRIRARTQVESAVAPFLNRVSVAVAGGRAIDARLFGARGD